MIDSSSIIRLVQPAASTNGNLIDRYSDLSLMFELVWRSGNTIHTDCRLQQELNLLQDFFPPQLEGELIGKTLGDKVSIDFDPGQLVPVFENSNTIEVDPSRFKAPSYKGLPVLPAKGRFYPKGFIAGVKGLDPRDVTPMRITGIGAQLEIDLNHPLASRDLSLTGTVVDIAASGKSARGGLCRDVGDLITANGPGMQARWRNQPTDFWSGDPFVRNDTSPDPEFYEQPRLVSHVDSNASALIGELHRQWIPDHARVLDLMASWESHLPDSLSLSHLTGLGMNAEELARNTRMDDRVIKDLNIESRLPFDAGTFDAVICTVSVEYLVRPLEVFADVGRVLKPGGRFVVTFSNRWFPPKAIRAWELLHEYERMGMVLEYFQLSEKFSDLRTWSLRGLPRPADDKYADRLTTSDPVYAVCGTRAVTSDSLN